MIRMTAVEGWNTAVTPEVDEIFPIWAQITIGCGTGVLSLIAVTFVCMCIRRRKHAKLRNEAQSLKGEKDVETTSKDVKDNISDSASTATPDRVNGGVQTDVSGDLFDLDDISMSGPVHSSDAVSVGLGPVDSSSHGAKADV